MEPHEEKWWTSFNGDVKQKERILEEIKNGFYEIVDYKGGPYLVLTKIGRKQYPGM